MLNTLANTNVVGARTKMSAYTPTEEEKQRFMSRAIELSEEGVSKGHGGPYGSVIVKDGKIVGQ